MEIPTSFPTDNLYKFLAIFGLVVLLVSIVYPEMRMSELGLEEIDARTELKIFQRTGESLAGQVDNLLELLDDPPAIGRTRPVVDSLSRAADVSYVRTMGQIERLKYLISETERIAKWGVVGRAVGTVLMILGFLLWYKKVQGPQDILLERQLEASRKQNSREGVRDSGGES